jgi:hypothetical protein
VARPEWRRALLTLVVVAIAAIALASAGGPLAGRLVRMDAPWLAVIADKDYLFPLSWPIAVWVTNLAAIPVIAAGWLARRRRGALVERETALVAGAAALLILFVCWLPFDAAHVALAVQLQVSRVFWLLDLLATLYLVWIAADAGDRRAVIAAVVIALLSAARGVYIMRAQFPDRPLFAIELRHDDWRDAMTWARATPKDTGWLADPYHAARYGSSVRVAAERDVLLERLKDTALAMYDRDIAMRVADREAAFASVAWDSPDGARALARRYDLDYLVVDHPLALPLAHRAGSLFIYRLK